MFRIYDFLTCKYDTLSSKPVDSLTIYNSMGYNFKMYI